MRSDILYKSTLFGCFSPSTLMSGQAGNLPHFSGLYTVSGSIADCLLVRGGKMSLRYSYAQLYANLEPATTGPLLTRSRAAIGSRRSRRQPCVATKTVLRSAHLASFRSKRPTMSFFPSKLRLFLTAAVTLSSLYGPPIHQQLRVLGILSRDEPAGNVHGVDGQIRLIPGTIQCEDLHHHERSGLLFTACEGEGSARLGWFPPTGLFDDPHSVPTEAGKRGELVVVDPKVSRRWG